jgi:hypothetical protein
VQKTAKEEQKIKKRLPKTTRPKHQPSKIFLKGKLKIILDKSIFSEYTSDIKRKRSLL